MTTMDKEALTAAFGKKDARLDGQVFVGVASTGIYCRPVCRARRPKIDSCVYYRTAAEAEQAGYRPCLLCRPECAPGVMESDATDSLAIRIAQTLEENCASGKDFGTIVARIGDSEQHARQVFMEAYRVDPDQALQTYRMHLAKSLLTDTSLPIAQIAVSTGFSSPDRLNDAFKAHYRFHPASLRKRVEAGHRNSKGITLMLGYRPPYRWDVLLSFFSARAIREVEKIADGKYYRSIRLATAHGAPLEGWLCVANDEKRRALSVSMSESLWPVLPTVLLKVKQQFDLRCDPHAVYEILQAMNEIRPGLCIIGTRLPGCFDPFEMAVRAVLGQQISVKAANTLAARMVKEFGAEMQTGMEGLTRSFPSAEEVLSLGDSIEERFGELGVTSARSRTIRELAKMSLQSGAGFWQRGCPEEEIEKLTAIKGIGSWTAHYIAMRAMGEPDAFLETDHGVKKALSPLLPKEVLKVSDAWRPWRSYATVNLWNSLT